jgi:hypothetical protein
MPQTDNSQVNSNDWMTADRRCNFSPEPGASSVHYRIASTSW